MINHPCENIWHWDHSLSVMGRCPQCYQKWKGLEYAAPQHIKDELEARRQKFKQWIEGVAESLKKGAEDARKCQDALYAKPGRFF